MAHVPDASPAEPSRTCLAVPPRQLELSPAMGQTQTHPTALPVPDRVGCGGRVGRRAVCFCSTATRAVGHPLDWSTAAGEGRGRR